MRSCVRVYECVTRWCVWVWQSSPKILHPRNLPDGAIHIFTVSRGANSNWDVGLIWMCTEEFKFLDLVDFSEVAFSMEFAIWQFPLRMLLPQIHQMYKVRLLGISWYKSNMRVWFNLNLYWEMWVSRYGGFRGSSIFKWICHMWMRHNASAWSHVHRCVFWNISMSPVMCHTHEPILSNIPIRPVTPMDLSCHTYR